METIIDRRGGAAKREYTSFPEIYSIGEDEIWSLARKLYDISIVNKTEAKRQYERAEAAERELAAAQADNARYRWLRDQASIVSPQADRKSVV